MLMDALGRPLLLEDRLAALGDIGSRFGLYQGRGTMQAMCWWEECISAFLGSVVEPHAWETMEGVPNSPRVDEVLDAWGVEGNWTPCLRERSLGGDMTLGVSILKHGRLAACDGVHERNSLYLAPRDYRPWYQTMQGFIDGMTHVDHDVKPCERLNISTMRQERDIGAVLSCDPDFLTGNWRNAGSPGRIQCGPPANCAPDLVDFKGNNAGYAMSYWTRVPQENVLNRPAADGSFQAAWLFSRFLLQKAAKILPDLGDRVFLAHSKTLSCVETQDGQAKVTARFRLDGVDVAWADWVEDTETVDRSWTGRDGVHHPWHVEKANHLLVNVVVLPPYRRQGIGTYVMRHAVTQGCCRASPPFSEAEKRLWGLHGCPGPRGPGDEWTMGAVGWPICPTEKMQEVPASPTLVS